MKKTTCLIILAIIVATCLYLLTPSPLTPQTQPQLITCTQTRTSDLVVISSTATVVNHNAILVCETKK